MGEVLEMSNGQNVAEENYETHTDFHNATAADDTLADATIEEGDEHGVTT